MKKQVLASVLIFLLVQWSPLLATSRKDDDFNRAPVAPGLTFGHHISLFALPDIQGMTQANSLLQPDDDSVSIDMYSQRVLESVKQFSLVRGDIETFTLQFFPQITPALETQKNYPRAAFRIVSINLILWSFNHYVMGESWTNISLDSMLTNLQSGFDWDTDTFVTNQLGHPYHGAVHYSMGRVNGLSFLESTLFSTLGSLTWEIFLESIQPSTNDLLMNTLGGITLGEVLYRIADLIIDESSVGLERALRETIAFLVNPAFGFRAFSGEAFRIGYPPEKRYYSLEFPIGAYNLPSENTSFLFSAGLEYKDFLKDSSSPLSPYDWFSLDFRLGIRDAGVRDKEIFTTGVLTGKKVRNGLAGLFGVFDYIDSYALNKMSAVGIGPGLVIISASDSELFFNSSGVLSVIFGGSSPSFNPPNPWFGTKYDDPYYLGPGMLGRFKLELGKKGVGSIGTGFTQYWVHSIFENANEFLSILFLNLKCDMTVNSQISLGYDYYLRHGTLNEQSASGAKPALRALYILKF